MGKSTSHPKRFQRFGNKQLKPSRNPLYQNHEVSSAGTITYTLNAVDSTGQVSTDQITIKVTPCVSAFAGNILYTDSFSSYQGFFNGSPLGGATSQPHTSTVSGSIRLKLWTKMDVSIGLVESCHFRYTFNPESPSVWCSNGRFFIHDFFQSSQRSI